MKKMVFVAALFFFSTGLATIAHADLDGFLRSVNVQASADLGRYNVKLSTQFGVPAPQVDVIVRSVAAPADAFMVLQLSRMAGKPPETVLRTYQGNKGKGWGVIAKELGIKQGSQEFHALKRGDFAFTGEPGGGAERGHGKGKGKGKKHK